MKNILKSKFLQKDTTPNSDGSPQVESLASIEDLQKIILRERARADRQDHEFSVIVIDIEKFNHEIGLIDNVVQRLSSRLRSIDEIGWYEKHQIGIVLPYTSSESAVQVADDVIQLVSAERPAKLLKILSYPSIWPFKK